MTPIRFARELARDIKDARLVILEGAGHGFVRTRFNQTAVLIEEFLSEGVSISPGKVS